MKINFNLIRIRYTILVSIIYALFILAFIRFLLDVKGYDMLSYFLILPMLGFLTTFMIDFSYSNSYSSPFKYYYESVKRYVKDKDFEGKTDTRKI